MKKAATSFFLSCLLAIAAFAQDTFSIVAVDSLTGEVGSAGASCISADNLQVFFPQFDPDFIGDLLPGRGAINTQASYLEGNQQNASEQLASGSTPLEVRNWLLLNDVEGNAGIRQYGIVALQNGQPMASALTGGNCFDFKGHRVGANYSIQGNILLGAQVLDSMEARFLAAEAAGKCLSEQLMEAMQGAKIPGADIRCLDNGTSSMFAYIKVAKPDDDPAEPMLRLFVSYNPTGIEPIDSLQALFDATFACPPNATGEEGQELRFRLSPNPSDGEVEISFPAAFGAARLDVFDARGKLIFRRAEVRTGERFLIENQGVIFVRLTAQDGKVGWGKLIRH